MFSSREFRLARCLSATLLLVGMGLYAGSFAQTSQTLSLNIPQSLFLDCSPLTINLTLTQSQIENPQSLPIADWTCNVDALTQYRLHSTLVTLNTNISNAKASDFTADCRSASHGGLCARPISLDSSDPGNRLGTGRNTAGTGGAEFTGSIFVNVSQWDVGTLPGFYTGIILYFLSDTTP